MFRRNFCFLVSSSSLDIQAAYRILGLTPSKASPEDARQKYLKLARQHHPDMSNGDDTKMKQINLAYEVVQNYVAQHGKDAMMMKQHQNKNRDDYDGFGNENEEEEFGSSGEKKETAYQKRKNQRRKRDSSLRRDASPLGDASKWNTRPEFEWNAAIFSVNESDVANPANHPNSFNRHFSFNDDATIFKSVRSGATVEEVGRSMGRSAFAIEARMNSTQFKLRIQKMLKADKFQRRNNLDGDNSFDADEYEKSEFDDMNANSDEHRRNTKNNNNKLNSQANFQRQVHPYKDTVYRNPDYIAAKKKKEEFYEGDLPFLHPEEIPGSQNNNNSDDQDNFYDQFSAKKIQSAHGRSYAHLVNHMRSTNKSGGLKNSRKFY